MFIVKMMNGDKFKISEQTFNGLMGKAGLVYLCDVKGIVNLSSVSSILPEELAENIGNRRKLRDGGYAVMKSGQWVCEHDNSIKIDLSYYPELLESRTDLIK